jgi:hypothetical protein
MKPKRRGERKKGGRGGGEGERGTKGGLKGKGRRMTKMKTKDEDEVQKEDRPPEIWDDGGR